MSIEEPHSILAYEAICATILTSVRELQAMHDPTSYAADGGNGAGASADTVSAEVVVEAGLQHAMAA